MKRASATILLLLALFLLPLLLIAVILTGTGGASYGTGGGQALADAALAEYESGAQDGSYHHNDPKYWNFVWGSGWAFSNGHSTPWCACFVSYCGQQCGYIDLGIMTKTAAAIAEAEFYDGHPERGELHPNDGTYTPRVGDICVWADGGKFNINHENTTSHTGIVVEVAEDGKTFVTVEGNTHGSTVYKHEYQTGHNVDYFSTPAFPESEASDLSKPLTSGQTATLPTTHEHKAPDGKGNVEVGENRGTTDKIGRPFTYTNYTKFYGRWTKGTNQRKLSEMWNAAGRPSKQSIATINDYYLVAVSKRFGSVGDYLDIELSNGKHIQAIVADQKSDSDTLSKTNGDIESCQLGHYYPGSKQISVVEFETIKNFSSGDVSTAIDDWKGTNVVKITNKGSALDSKKAA